MVDELELQRYLRSHPASITREPFLDGGWESVVLSGLKTQFGIKSNRHAKYPNLVQFKYNQIESPMGERIVQESRGIILDESNGWRVVARPFDKFFNYGEGHAPKIDWATARVQEKVDGSLMILYNYMGEWLVATSGTADASGMVNGFPITFADLFWKTFNEMGLRLPDPDYQWAAFLFELTTPYNRVVVQHAAPKLTLIGMRWDSGIEWELKHFGYPYVQEFPLQSLADIEATFHAMDPVKQEGYVIVDGSFNRVKVKHPGYVAIHHMKDGFGIKRMVALVQSNEGSEFMAHFPEWAGAYAEVKDKYTALVNELEAAYDAIAGIENQKEFALIATKSRCPAALFARRRYGNRTMREFLSDPKYTDTVMRLLDVGSVELVSAQA